MCKSDIFAQFKKIFNDIDETQIQNYYFCTERNCNEICSDDLKTAKKDNKFKHKWLLDPKITKCDKTYKWCLVSLINFDFLLLHTAHFDKSIILPFLVHTTLRFLLYVSFVHFKHNIVLYIV